MSDRNLCGGSDLMLYKELYKESNELAKERFVLVRERVAEIEEKPETEEKYKEFFKSLTNKHKIKFFV